MPIRKRTLNTNQLKGWYYVNGTRFGSATSTFLAAKDYCEDEVGTGTDLGPLLIQKYKIDGGRINQPGPTSGIGRSFHNYVCDGAQFPAHLAIPQSPSDMIAAVEAAARTNPSKPLVDIPVALLELGDITKLLKIMGDRFIRSASQTVGLAGRTFISYQFGIKPIVDDLFKILEFKEALDRRIKVLKRLEGPRGLRKTVAISSNSAVADQRNFFWQSSGASLQGPRQTMTNEIVKAHVRWRTSTSYPKDMSDMQRRLLAIDAIQGDVVDFATVWELIPWSWLIDWASNVGQTFAANRNIVHAELMSIHIMRHQLTRVSGPALQVGTAKMGSVRMTYESKKRGANQPVFPTARLPFLDGKQMGILASLAVAKR